MADVEVKFGADASGAVAGAEETAGAIKGLEGWVQELTGFLLEMAGAATGSWREISRGARESAEAVKGTAEQIRAMRSEIKEFGEVLMAALAVEQLKQFAEKMAETAEQTYHTALTFGITTDQVQAFTAEMKGLGISPEAAINSFTRLDRAVARAREGSKQIGQAFKTVGVDIKEPMGQVEMFEKTVAGLSKIEDVPTRIGLAMQLLGRNIREIAPLLGTTPEQIEEIKKATDEYGAVNKEAEARGLALAESFNVNKIAMQGLDNVMADAFAPTLKVLVDGFNGLIKSLVDSYNKGGLVKGIVDLLVAAIQLLITAVSTTWSGFEQFFSFLQAGWYNIIAIANLAGGAIVSAVTLDGGKAFREGEANFSHWHDKAIEALKDVEREGDNWRKYMKEVWSPPQTPKLPGGKGPGTVPPLEGKGGPSQMAKWEEELHNKLTAEGNFFKDSKDEELKFWQDKLTSTTKGSKQQLEVENKIFELRKALAQQDLAEQLAVIDFKKQMAQDDFAEQMRLEQEKLDLLAKDYGVDSTNYQNALREKLKMTQEHNKQVLEMDVQRIQTEAKVAEDAAKLEGDLAKAKFQGQKSALNEAEASGSITPTQKAAEEVRILQEEQDEERLSAEKIYEIQAKALADAALLENMRPAQRQKILDELDKLEAQHAAKQKVQAAQDANAMQAAQNAAADATRNAWVQRLQPLDTAMNQLWSSWIKGGQTFGQTMRQMGENFALEMAQAFDKMVIKWIAQHILMTAVHAAATETQVGITAAGAAQQTAISASMSLKQLAHAAAVAAGNAYKALAGIPIIGPILGAGAAAVTFAAVLALGAGIASAAGGWDRVPSDGSMTELHKDEMVLSAQYARPLRAMLSNIDFGNVGVNGNSATAGYAMAGVHAQGNQSGDTFHFSPTINHHDTTWDKLVSREGTNMRRWVNSEIRNRRIGQQS